MKKIFRAAALLACSVVSGVFLSGCGFNVKYGGSTPQTPMFEIMDAYRMAAGSSTMRTVKGPNGQTRTMFVPDNPQENACLTANRWNGYLKDTASYGTDYNGARRDVILYIQQNHCEKYHM